MIKVVAVKPGFLRDCRRLIRLVDRSLHEMPPERQRVAVFARMTADVVSQPAFMQSASLQRRCFADIAAFKASAE